MGKTWALAGFVVLTGMVFSVGASAEEAPPSGLSAAEWRQMTSAIEFEQGRRGDELDSKHAESLYALAQKLAPESTLPEARFGFSVAVDGDIAVVGAAWAHLAFVFSREPGGWQLQQTLEGIWEAGSGCEYQSRYFGFSVAIDGPVISVGAPGYGCYYDNGSAQKYGNVFIFEETVPGSWSLTQNVLDTLDTWVLFSGSYLGTSVTVFGTTIATGAAGFFQSRGGCVVVTKSDGQWTYVDLLLAPSASAGDRFGHSVALFGDCLVVGAPNELVLLWSEAGRVHVFNRIGETWTHAVGLTASDSSSRNHFGASVSIVPPRILVGAPDDDHAAGADAGSAYVFTETGGVWSQSQKLVALDGEAGDRFGAAVALGFGVAVIGAPDDNHGMFNIDAGSAYVFTSIAGTWFQSQKIVAPDGEISDRFGSAVAVWGTTALVGSPFDDGPNVTNTGSAHFYEQTAGVWAHDGTVVGIREGLNKTFGYSVAVAGETLVVGVASPVLIGSGGGEAYIFARAADSWELEWVLYPGGDLRRFGEAVAISGDTVVVGAPGGALLVGSALVYQREFGLFGPTWELEETLLAGDGVMGDGFGAAVDIDGDNAVVGAPGRDIGSVLDCGAVYAFSRSGVVWHEDQLVTTSVPSAGDRFGGSIALQGDVFLAGSSGDDFPSAVDAGAAFVFRRVVGDWSEEQKLGANTPVSEAYFGHTVAIDGTTVLAGAPGTQVSGLFNAGAVHVFTESGGVWTEEQRLTPSTPAAESQFGRAVDIAGDTAVIGIPYRDLHPHAQVGSVVVFHRSASTWSQQITLVSDAPQTDAHFGWAVAASEDGLAVGAPGELYAISYPGAVYWFEGSIVETDLAIAMDDGVTEVVPGTGVSYLTVVTNAGPNEAMGATVADTFPPELLGCMWTCVAFGGATCTAGPVSGDIADTVDLPVSGRLEYTADCTVDPSATGTVANTATVTAPPGVADTNPLNNSATDSDGLTPEADLAISKDNGANQIVEGETTTYTIGVSNPGPSDAPASLVSDVFPMELADCSWTCTPGIGAACAPAGVGDISDLTDLPAGSDVTYLATCTVTASSGQCSNTAEVAPPAGVVDPNPLDNDATDTDPVAGLVDVVYVSRILEGEVAVIDVQTDAVIRLLPTGPNPAEIGIVTGLSRAFVADLTDGTVTVVDTGDHGIASVIDLGVPVAAVGIDEAAGRIYVVDYSNGAPGTDLHVIDADSLVELDVFTVGSRTQNIAVSAADDLAYVTDFDQGVNGVDTATGVVVRNLPMADLPHGVALDDTADRLYVTRLDADSVAIVDTTTFTVIDTLAVGDAPQWIALDPPRAKAFVTNESGGTVSVIDTASGTVHPTAIPVGPGPLTITVHEGAAKAYVYNTGDGTISVIDTVGETVITTLAPLFVDGFESGDTSAWTAVAP